MKIYPWIILGYAFNRRSFRPTAYDIAWIMQNMVLHLEMYLLKPLGRSILENNCDIWNPSCIVLFFHNFFTSPSCFCIKFNIHVFDKWIIPNSGISDLTFKHGGIRTSVLFNSTWKSLNFSKLYLAIK